MEWERKINIRDNFKVLDLRYWELGVFCRDEKRYGVTDGVESWFNLRCLLEIHLEMLSTRVEMRG